MRRLRITTRDPNVPQLTQVVDADTGVRLDGVVSVDLHINGGRDVTADVKFIQPELDIIAYQAGTASKEDIRDLCAIADDAANYLMDCSPDASALRLWRKLSGQVALVRKHLLSDA